MEKIYNYIRLALKDTFYESFEFDIEKYSEHFINAIEEVRYDCNIKYFNKLKVNNTKDILTLVKIDSTIEAVFLYRLERSIYLKDSSNQLLPFLASLMRRRTNCEIYYSTKIGRGLNIQHGFGIVIGPRFEIGENFIIHQGVTLGQKNLNSPDEKIIIGDNVTLFANSTILGNIKIASGTVVGANSVLLSDTEKNSVYVGVPAKRIR